MRLQQVTRTDAEKVFIIVKNTSGGTLAANVPVFWETDAVTDGLAVSQMVTGAPDLFAGITDASITDGSIGSVQVYGVRTSAVVIAGDSAISYLPGTTFYGVAGQNYLQAFSARSGATVGVNSEKYVVCMETIASADGKSATRNCQVFIHAL